MTDRGPASEPWWAPFLIDDAVVADAAPGDDGARLSQPAGHTRTARLVSVALTMRLEGELVVLEPLEARHEAALAEVAADDEVWRWLTGCAPTREAFGRWFEHALSEVAAGREGPFATIERATGRAIGSSRYLAVRAEHRGLEIGWTWLAASAWRSGANVEAKL